MGKAVEPHYPKSGKRIHAAAFAWDKLANRYYAKRFEMARTLLD